MWVKEKKHVWRIILMLLAVVAFAGPWFYEQLYVPGEYECEPPSFRLDGDFCGWPIRGLWLFSILPGFPKFIVRLVTEVRPWSQALREAFFLLLYLPLLPILNTLVLIVRKQNQRPGVFQLVAWGLALGISIFIIVVGRKAPLGALWGMWLYAAVAAAALLLEVLLRMGQNRNAQS